MTPKPEIVSAELPQAFALPLAPSWADIHERLARAARYMHLQAVAGEPASGTTLLAIMQDFAPLVMSPVGPHSAAQCRLVDSATLFAAQSMRAHTQTV